VIWGVWGLTSLSIPKWGGKKGGYGLEFLTTKKKRGIPIAKSMEKGGGGYFSNQKEKKGGKELPLLQDEGRKRVTGSHHNLEEKKKRIQRYPKKGGKGKKSKNESPGTKRNNQIISSEVKGRTKTHKKLFLLGGRRRDYNSLYGKEGGKGR